MKIRTLSLLFSIPFFTAHGMETTPCTCSEAIPQEQIKSIEDVNEGEISQPMDAAYRINKIMEELTQQEKDFISSCFESLRGCVETWEQAEECKQLKEFFDKRGISLDFIINIQASLTKDDVAAEALCSSEETLQ